MKTGWLVVAAMAVVSLGSAAPALAQDPTTVDPATATQEDDHDFPWGLLGLIGLGGLLGLKRRDDHHRTTTGTGRT